MSPARSVTSATSQREQGDFAGAHLFYRESLEAFQALDHRRGIARLLDCFAGSAAAQLQPERALRLAGAAAALRETIGAVLAPAEQDRLAKSLEAARAALSDAAGTSAWMEGWGMPAEEAMRSSRKSEPG